MASFRANQLSSLRGSSANRDLAMELESRAGLRGKPHLRRLSVVNHWLLTSRTPLRRSRQANCRNASSNPIVYFTSPSFIEPTAAGVVAVRILNAFARHEAMRWPNPFFSAGLFVENRDHQVLLDRPHLAKRLTGICLTGFRYSTREPAGLAGMFTAPPDYPDAQLRRA